MRKVLLIGQGPTTGSALGSLLPLFRVVGLVRTASDATTAVAHRHGIRVITDASVTAIEAAARELEPDCVVVSSYDRILPARLLARCPFVNVHYAPLPGYRGRAPVNWAIINHRPAVAMTVHVLVAELDAGPILTQQHIAIGAHDTITDVYARLNEMQRAHLGAAVERHLDGDPGVPQYHGAATYGCTRVPADGEIDWRRPTRDVYALVRALTDPFPGAFTHLDARRLVVWRAAPVESPLHWTGRVPGRVVGRSAAEGWADVLTGDGVLRLHTVELELGHREAGADVIKSVRVTLGLRAADLLERVRDLEEQVRLVSADQRPDDDPRSALPARGPRRQARSPQDPRFGATASGREKGGP